MKKSSISVNETNSTEATNKNISSITRDHLQRIIEKCDCYNKEIKEFDK